MTTVAILHPGQMGAAVAREAARNATRVVWCCADRSEASAQRAAEAGLEAYDDLPEMLAVSEVAISLCPPAAAEDVAAQVAAAKFSGLFVEANAISPQRSIRISQTLTDAGARVVDGCVIGPPPPGKAGTRLHLSGPHAEATTVADLFTGTAVDAVVLDGRLGAASALKMAYGSYQKAASALAAISHALATSYGVDAQLTLEARRLDRSMLADPGYLSSVAARAWRWASEMREGVETLTAAGLPADLSRAAGAVFELWEDDKDAFDLTPEVAVAHLREAQSQRDHRSSTPESPQEPLPKE